MSFNTKNYNEQGGARDVVGGSLDVVSGGEIDIESGGALKIAGTDRTSALNALAAADTAILAATTTAGTWANILGSGNGYGKDYAKTANGDDTLAPDPGAAASLILIVTVTEAFVDDSSDDQTIIKIGDAADGDEYMDATVLVDAPLGAQFVIQDTMASGDIVNVNVTAATGDSTGAVNIMAFIKLDD